VQEGSERRATSGDFPLQNDTGDHYHQKKKSVSQGGGTLPGFLSLARNGKRTGIKKGEKQFGGARLREQLHLRSFSPTKS